MHVIDKEYSASYAHRVWSQMLDDNYSLDCSCKCKYFHGHNFILKVGLQALKLERGMVTDFKHLNVIKKLVDDVIDHKFIFDINDPIFSNFLPEVDIEKDLIDYKHYKLINLDNFKHLRDTDTPESQAIYEKLEGMVIVNFVPTSENLCKFFAEVADECLRGLEGYGDRFKLAYIDFWETPKSHCRYEVQ